MTPLIVEASLQTGIYADHFRICFFDLQAMGSIGSTSCKLSICTQLGSI